MMLAFEYEYLGFFCGALAAIVALWGYCLVVAADVGQRNGRWGFSISLTLLLGPIGLAIASLLPQTAEAEVGWEEAIAVIRKQRAGKAAKAVAEAARATETAEERRRRMDAENAAILARAGERRAKEGPF